jgi:hypothetical protein
MNKLINLLQLENELTIPRLKKVYRILCKKTHPDITKGPDSKFIELRKEYEEAYAIISNLKTVPADPEKEAPAAKKKEPAPEKLREAVMENLYLYSLKVLSPESEDILLDLIHLTESYNSEVHEILKSYYQVFFKRIKYWRHNGLVFYAHNLVISSIRQLFYYYSLSMPHHRTVLLSYLNDVPKRSKRLEAEQQRVLNGLAEWLWQEMDGEKIVLL